MEPGTKRTWIWIVVGVLGVLTVGCLAVVGTGIYVVSRQMQVAVADARTAQREFDAARDRFRGQAPLITLDAEGRMSDDALRRRIESYSGPLPSSLHVLAWEEDEGRLVRFSMPFWLLRLGKSGTANIRVDEFDFDRLHLDSADLERAGPALLVDHTSRESRVLVWSE